MSSVTLTCPLQKLVDAIAYTDETRRPILQANGHIDVSVLLHFDMPAMPKALAVDGKDIPYWEIYKHTFEDGSSYEGNWKNGVFHGSRGKFVFADGVRAFEGEFVDGQAQLTLPRLRVALDRQ